MGSVPVPGLEAATELATFCNNFSGHSGRDELAVSFRGSCATVHKGILRTNGIKCISSEACIWSQLCHENTALLLGFTTTFDVSVSLVFPWHEKGTVFKIASLIPTHCCWELQRG
ncbi:hypothetical protein SCLCIDRAFT_637105 [Scleroderma citrinum Foug A]|uniref:Uncharacterized protein n=1 Tax=Scleroderma citrinum Foug A TaxID=1036808 RepID=A0A0C3CSD4_9AGAM|nr:hypothetical protein SCLCIDRAFT_637105 [Scleroderma citrinum Foug A]